MARPPAIDDYAIIGDCHSAALVSRAGSVDWCCMPRFDSGSSFGRLIDYEHGGYCSIAPSGKVEGSSREYVDDTLVLATSFHTGGGRARLLDCFTRHEDVAGRPHPQLLRIVEGERGQVELAVDVVPRFDYGEVRPWLRRLGLHAFAAIGGDDGLVVCGDVDLEPSEQHALTGRVSLRAGERVRLAVTSMAPAQIDASAPELPTAADLDEALERTLDWWREWSSRMQFGGADAHGVRRSAMVLKALTYEPTGAIVAAPTTSLPEAPGANRNWDYRYSWIRDSTFSIRSLAELGWQGEADAFRRFVERSAAGAASELQIMFGVGGERRLTEIELPALRGYGGARPVRVGNQASSQLQLDAYGELLNQAWRWYERGHEPDDDYWRFLHELVETAVERWSEPDSGLWEWRQHLQHFVHSKAMCWVAVDRGLALAEACMRKAPVARWRRTRDEIREAVDAHGYDADRGIFVQAFGSSALDAALLLLPGAGYIAFEDERMVRTTDAIRDELDDDGLLRRYRREDEFEGEEGAFLACSFWLVECLVRQGRGEDARAAFDRAYATANDLGLFSEEFDTNRQTMLGNFPQALTHLSQIAAAVALAEHDPAHAGAAAPIR